MYQDRQGVAVPVDIAAGSTGTVYVPCPFTDSPGARVVAAYFIPNADLARNATNYFTARVQLLDGTVISSVLDMSDTGEATISDGVRESFPIITTNGLPEIPITDSVIVNKVSEGGSGMDMNGNLLVVFERTRHSVA